MFGLEKIQMIMMSIQIAIASSLLLNFWKKTLAVFMTLVNFQLVSS